MISEPVLVGIGTLGAFAIRSARQKAAAAAQRVRDIKRSDSAFDRHMDALEKVCADDSVPLELKLQLLEISEYLDDEGFVKFYADNLLGGLHEFPSASGTSIGHLFDGLSPDALQEVSVAFRSMMSGAFLRWPETAPNLADLLLAMSGRSESREVRDTIRVHNEFARRQNSPSPSGMAYA